MDYIVQHDQTTRERKSTFVFQLQEAKRGKMHQLKGSKDIILFLHYCKPFFFNCKSFKNNTSDVMSSANKRAIQTLPTKAGTKKHIHNPDPGMSLRRQNTGPLCLTPLGMHSFWDWGTVSKQALPWDKFSEFPSNVLKKVPFTSWMDWGFLKPNFRLCHPRNL